MKKYFKYEIEMYSEIEQKWKFYIRYYKFKKPLDDFDLYPITNKRRNSKFLGTTLKKF